MMADDTKDELDEMLYVSWGNSRSNDNNLGLDLNILGLVKPGVGDWR
jgi:hypothetical protein